MPLLCEHRPVAQQPVYSPVISLYALTIESDRAVVFRNSLLLLLHKTTAALLTEQRSSWSSPGIEETKAELLGSSLI